MGDRARKTTRAWSLRWIVVLGTLYREGLHGSSLRRRGYDYYDESRALGRVLLSRACDATALLINLYIEVFFRQTKRALIFQQRFCRRKFRPIMACAPGPESDTQAFHHNTCVDGCIFMVWISARGRRSSERKNTYSSSLPCIGPARSSFTRPITRWALFWLQTLH